MSGACQSELVTEWNPADNQPPNADVSFTGTPGIKCDVMDFKPIDFFQLFFL